MVSSFCAGVSMNLESRDEISVWRARADSSLTVGRRWARCGPDVVLGGEEEKRVPNRKGIGLVCMSVICLRECYMSWGCVFLGNVCFFVGNTCD